MDADVLVCHISYYKPISYTVDKIHGNPVERYSDRAEKYIEIMRIKTFNQYVLSEDITHADFDQYAKAVAKAYAEAPVVEKGTIAVHIDGREYSGTVYEFWDALNESNHRLYKHILSKYKVEFVDDDPYETGVLKIYKGGSDHPYLSKEDNWVFRTVHDYYTHIVTHTENFDLRGELRAYNTHAKLVPPMALPALFTELVGQVCYNIVNGDFPEQKLAVLRGFDFRHVGI
jgi:hypothetical protein